MKPIVQHILVPIQPGDEGVKAIRQAMVFREKYGSLITFLCTIPAKNWFYRLMHPMHLVRKKKKVFREIKSMLSGYFGGTVPGFVRIKIKKGGMVSVLIRFINRRKYDLVIINKNLEQRPSVRPLWESGIIRITGEAFCPVVVFGDAPLNPEIRKILVPVEYNRRHRHNLHWAIEFAQRYGATVNLVSFLSGGIKIEQSRVFRKILRIRKWLEKQHVSCDVTFLEVQDKSRDEVLCDFINKRRPDMVLIMTHQEALFDINHIGKLAEGVIRNAEAPVFAITPKKETLFTALLDVMLPKKFRDKRSGTANLPENKKTKTNRQQVS